MSRKVFEEFLSQQQEQYNYHNLVALFISKKQELEELDKEVKKLNDALKEKMEAEELSVIEQDGYKITKIKSQRVIWKEDVLLDKVKSYEKPELIKQVEQVDIAALEQAIIDEVVNINDLADCQKITNVTSLRLNRIKEGDK